MDELQQLFDEIFGASLKRASLVRLLPVDEHRCDAEGGAPEQGVPWRLGTEWMTAEEAWRYLRFPSRNALYEAVRRGQVPHYRLGRRLRFKRDELDEWLKKKAGWVMPESTKGLLPERRRRRGRR